MKVQGVRCLNCNDWIYSKHRHDFVWCSCKSCAIDGGRDYTRVLGDFDAVVCEERDLEDDVRPERSIPSTTSLSDDL